MSLSAEVAKFLLVSAVYIGFTFAWGWYKGREEEKESEAEDVAAGTGGEA